MSELEKIITGQTDSHVVALGKTSLRIHREVVIPFLEMQKAAKADGFALEICSGFRDFSSQLNIWNAKAGGKRPVLDTLGKPVDLSLLQPLEILYAILRWSALPGASRHHWGTDFDIFDSQSMPAGYQVQLIPSEYETGGVFSGMSEWLDAHMENFGFFRPYAIDLGGVSPERWHVSYAPLAENYLEELDEKLLRQVIESAEISLKETVLEELANVYRRFVRNISYISTG